MTKKRANAIPPLEASAAGEDNAFVAALKSSLSKRWSLTGMETLYEISDLVAFLYALGREGEAAAVADSVASIVQEPPPLPSGGYNYNIWCPATLSHAFIVHINMPSLSTQAAHSRAALLRDPGVARSNSDFIAGGLADARKDSEQEASKRPTKPQRQQTARHLSKAVLYSVLANAGDAAFVGHRQAADNLTVSLRLRLRLLLEPGA